MYIVAKILFNIFKIVINPSVILRIEMNKFQDRSNLQNKKWF